MDTTSGYQADLIVPHNMPEKQPQLENIEIPVKGNARSYPQLSESAPLRVEYTFLGIVSKQDLIGRLILGRGPDTRFRIESE